MFTINGQSYPNHIMNEKEMCRSLKICKELMKELKENGLPYFYVLTATMYEPNEVWKWYREYRREKK